MLRSFSCLALLLSAPILAMGCGSRDEELLLGVTTSVSDTGLLDALVDAFEARYDYNVKPIVGGSGQVLEQARRGELDVIMTHSPADEEKLIEDGFATERTQVMRNYFMIAGPTGDPAGVAAATSMTEAFGRIASGEHGFVSRGDGSGTHRREQSMWEKAGVDPVGEEWYTESATGQGQNLLVANDNDAYTLVDSSTFISFEKRVQVVELLRDEDDPNVYSVLRLDAGRLTKVNEEGAEAWLAFMSGEGQELIAGFGREEYGEPLFETLDR
jgi:tungstate transport system substrate-binding protein